MHFTRIGPRNSSYLYLLSEMVLYDITDSIFDTVLPAKVFS